MVGREWNFNKHKQGLLSKTDYGYVGREQNFNKYTQELIKLPVVTCNVVQPEKMNASLINKF